MPDVKGLQFAKLKIAAPIITILSLENSIFCDLLLKNQKAFISKISVQMVINLRRQHNKGGVSHNSEIPVDDLTF